jgi:hypothetical protein
MKDMDSPSLAAIVRLCARLSEAALLRTTEIQGDVWEVDLAQEICAIADETAPP